MYSNEETELQDASAMTKKGVAQMADIVAFSYMKKNVPEAKQNAGGVLSAAEQADLDRFGPLNERFYETLNRQGITISKTGRGAIQPGTGLSAGCDLATLIPSVAPRMTVKFGAQFAARQVGYDRTAAGQDDTKVDASGGQLKWAAGAKAGTAVDTFGPQWVTHFSGVDWAIYVLSPSGNLHVASHKVGMYHHSSLLAGVPVAAAGEIQVQGGAVKTVTNKSGHYMPGEEHLRNMLWFLSKRVGVSLASFKLEVHRAGAKTPYNTASAYMDVNKLKAEHQEDKGVHSLLQDYGGMIRVGPLVANNSWTGLQLDRKSSNKPADWVLLRLDGTPAKYADVQKALRDLGLTRDKAKAPLTKFTQV